MTIVYALVARGSTILCQFSAASGNMEQIARRILDKLPAQGEFQSCYEHDTNMWSVTITAGITYLCLAPKDFGRRRPVNFLKDASERFQSTAGAQAQTALAFAFQDKFSGTLKQRMEHFSSANADNLSRVQNDIDEVKNIMIQNVDKVIDRGEKLEVLVTKTDNLSNQANQFKKGAGKLRKAMWWKNMKLNLMICMIILAVIGIIIASICGTGDTCKSDDE